MAGEARGKGRSAENRSVRFQSSRVEFSSKSGEKATNAWELAVAVAKGKPCRALRRTRATIPPTFATRCRPQTLCASASRTTHAHARVLESLTRGEIQ